jgi:hypothetical protein
MRYSGSVESLIYDIIRENDLDAKEEAKLSNFIGDALRELNNDTKPSIVEIRKDLPANRILKIPADFVDWVKIGVLYKEGVKALAQNRYLAKGVSTENAQSIYTYPRENAEPRNVNFQYYGIETGRNEGFGNGGDLGGFVVDEKNKIITFSDRIPSGPIYFAYLSDCRYNNKDTIVHPYCIQWVKTYALAELLLRKKDPNYRIFEAKEMIERRQMRKRIMGMGKEDFVNVYEQQYGANE